MGVWKSCGRSFGVDPPPAAVSDDPHCSGIPSAWFGFGCEVGADGAQGGQSCTNRRSRLEDVWPEPIGVKAIRKRVRQPDSAGRACIEGHRERASGRGYLLRVLDPGFSTIAVAHRKPATASLPLTAFG